jgi:hypothetical protein
LEKDKMMRVSLTPQLSLAKPAPSDNVTGISPVSRHDAQDAIRFGEGTPRKKKLIWAGIVAGLLGITNMMSCSVGIRHGEKAAVEDAAMKNVNSTRHWCNVDAKLPPGAHHVEAMMPIPGYFEKVVKADLQWKLVDPSKLPPELHRDLKNPPFAVTQSDTAEEFVNELFSQKLAGFVRSEWYTFDEADPKAFTDRMHDILMKGFDPKHTGDKSGVGSPTFKDTDLYNLSKLFERHGIQVLGLDLGVEQQKPAIQRPTVLDSLKMEFQKRKAQLGF